MNKEEYRKLLTHPLWKAKRLEILERDGHKCAMCGGTTYLQVHHKIYEPINPWESRNDDLITICNSCHKEWHKLNGNLYRSYFKRFTTNTTFSNEEGNRSNTSTEYEVIGSKDCLDRININDENSIILKSLLKLNEDVVNLSNKDFKNTLKIKGRTSGDYLINLNIYVTYQKKSSTKIIKTKKKK